MAPTVPLGFDEFAFLRGQGVNVVNEGIDLLVEGKYFTLQHFPFT
ncbi:MAG: hypothetical protein Q4D38_01605 [Planctomycetia bacterium]|nr:hypothetical protein [Planctomycetia bacterium]